MQNLGIFWSKIRQPFRLYKFQPVWIIQKIVKPCGACSSASLSERRCPDRADDIPTVATTAVLPPTVSPSCRLHSTASGDYNGSTPPPLFFLFRRFTALAPLQTPSCSPSLSHCEQPTPAPLQLPRPHPKHRATEYFLPNRSDPASNPCSGLPTSFPHHRSPPQWTSLPMSPLTPPPSPLPPIRSATLPAYSPATPPAAGQPDFAGKPPVPMGKKASPGSTSGQKAEMGRALSDPDGPSHYRGSPFEQCTLQIFPSDYT
jgi:hypothetical protein